MSDDGEGENLSLKIDQRLEAYRSYYDHAWARKIMGIVDGTKLDRLAFLLTVNIRGVVNCGALPWLMINSLSNLSKSFLADKWEARFLAFLSVELPKRMNGRISRMRQKEMAQMIRELGEKLDQGFDTADPTVSAESYWDGYLKEENVEWLAAIWGSQRLVFCGLWFAYEGFVKDVIAIAKNDPDYKGHWPELVADTKRLFGDDLGAECLEGDFIQISQRARHALAHSSGKETSKLREKAGHGLDVVDGLLHIQPTDNAILCKAIKKRSLLLVEAAVKLPQCQPS